MDNKSSFIFQLNSKMPKELLLTDIQKHAILPDCINISNERTDSNRSLGETLIILKSYREMELRTLTYNQKRELRSLNMKISFSRWYTFLTFSRNLLKFFSNFSFFSV